MSKVRVYELAKELDVPSKRIIDLLGEIGFPVKNHMSVVEENAAKRIRYQLTGKGEPPAEYLQEIEAAKSRESRDKAPNVPAARGGKKRRDRTEGKQFAKGAKKKQEKKAQAPAAQKKPQEEKKQVQQKPAPKEKQKQPPPK